MDCILCTNLMVKFTDDSYLDLPVFQCKKCDFLVTGESLDEIKEKTISIYKKDFWVKEGDSKTIIKNNYTDIDSQGKIRNHVSQYKYCKPYLKNKKKILEIGAGQGQSVYLFDKEGYSVEFIEPDKNNVMLINQKLGKDCGIIDTAENFQSDKKFEIIWMSHVLEHLTNPIMFFKNISKNLINDGILFIEVPNCENPLVLDKSIHKVPHTFHFSKSSLIKIVEKCNFKVISCDYFRPATKLEGISNKLKKFPFYPRILTNNKKGEVLRIILKI
jgi:2-polyprenyl-3-methyl-5-hydroxy-6-metoxy-1,4-benzoquinol methylase